METFHDVISGNQLVLVDFLATWCQPLMLFRNGEVLYRESGAMSQADLMDLLDPFI